MDIREQIAVVQSYINHRAGKTVQISILDMADMVRLQQAYKIAIQWFNNNNGQINLI